MGDIDAELARFEAELAQVEQAVAAEPPPSQPSFVPPAQFSRPAPQQYNAPAPSSAPTVYTHQYAYNSNQHPPPPGVHLPHHGAHAPPPAFPPPMYMMPQYGAPPVQQVQVIEEEEEEEEAPAAPAAVVKPGKIGKTKEFVRLAGGQVWKDHTLNEWPENDFRIFVGDLGNEVTDELLAKAFNKYASFAKAKIVRDKRTNKTKGFGFVSFLDSTDFAKALREMNGKYIGNRPCKLTKSDWDERNFGQKKRTLGPVAEALKKARKR